MPQSHMSAVSSLPSLAFLHSFVMPLEIGTEWSMATLRLLRSFSSQGWSFDKGVFSIHKNFPRVNWFLGLGRTRFYYGQKEDKRVRSDWVLWIFYIPMSSQISYHWPVMINIFSCVLIVSSQSLIVNVVFYPSVLCLSDWGEFFILTLT